MKDDNKVIAPPPKRGEKRPAVLYCMFSTLNNPPPCPDVTRAPPFLNSKTWPHFQATNERLHEQGHRQTFVPAVAGKYLCVTQKDRQLGGCTGHCHFVESFNHSIYPSTMENIDFCESYSELPGKQTHNSRKNILRVANTYQKRNPGWRQQIFLVGRRLRISETLSSTRF